MTTTTNLDRAASGLSLACIVHCLLLPILASTMPFLAAAAEAEWIHWCFAIAAVFMSASVPILAVSARTAAFLIPAGLGVTLISAGLFAEGFGIDETIPTVAGGALIAIAHMLRLRGH